MQEAEGCSQHRRRGRPGHDPSDVQLDSPLSGGSEGREKCEMSPILRRTRAPIFACG
jgi:hypothetical protein